MISEVPNIIRTALNTSTADETGSVELYLNEFTLVHC